MKVKFLLFCLGLLAGTYQSAHAQSFIPPNLDFETGTTANWKYYHGTVASGFVYTLASTPATIGQHEITSGTGTDMYGGFPVVGIGSHSLKLNHDISGAQADAATYDIAIPSTGTYSLIYQYAVVQEDPSHMPVDQPVLEVQAIDSATGTVFFDSVIYPPTPGFMTSTVTTTVAEYKAWTNVSVDMSAYSGKTVTMKFIAAGCSAGGHFAYAYIDLSDVFETYTMLPLHAPSVTLTAPGGYAAYKWTDAATFTAAYGTTKSVTIPAPTAKKKYALILTPAAGHGTVDTVYKTVDIASTVSVAGPSQNAGVNIFPNPTTGTANIQWTNQQAGLATLEVTDVIGRVVNRTVLNMDVAGRQQINLSNEANGIYLVTIKSDAVNYTGKIVVQK